MIALAYLVVTVLLGDLLTRRWLRPVSSAHRLATAFLVGLLVGTWLTYVASLAAANSEQPLVVGNAVMFAVVGPIVVLERLRSWWSRGWSVRRPATSGRPARSGLRPAWRSLWTRRLDWLVVLAFGAFVTWMAFTTFGFDGTSLRIGIHEIGDFGPNTSIAASFALGHNFPTEYPMFAGERILYHFLFYFQGGNLTFLGWDPAMSGNVLFIGSMVSLLVVLMAFGERIFRSIAVGRLAAVLFFLHGSLSFIPYLASFESVEAAVAAIPKSDRFLSSNFPYRGEDWAIWTQNVFLNQRHLASAIGVLLVVLLFVVERARAADLQAADESPLPRRRRIGAWSEGRTSFAARRPSRETVGAGLRDPHLAGYLACGALLGLLPLWNGAIYLAGAVVMAGVLVLFRNRVQMLLLAAVAGALSLPQVLFLRPDGVQSTQYPSFHWGFTIPDPSPINVATYAAFLFGPKLVLMGVALARSSGFLRRLFLALSGLAVVAFTFQLSVDIANNQKLLTLWLIVGNLFVAAGLVRLWRTVSSARLGGVRPLLGRLAAVALAAVIAVGGVIDLIPISNDAPQILRMQGDRLYEWVRDQTDRRAVFLTDLHIHHPILRAGRKIYLGWPAYPHSMGHTMRPREESYRHLLSSSSPRDVVRDLQAAGIDYVAFDDGLRQGTYVGGHNEAVYRKHFAVAYEDPGDDHGDITIYQVPTDPEAWRSLPGAPPVDAFTGGRGNDAGRFLDPRGLAVAPDGGIYVADTGNNRVQRFGPDGRYIGEFGGAGEEPGDFTEPNGVAVDSRGHVFVADLADRVQEFDQDGTFVGEWRASEPAFYGPRDVAIAADESVYVLDQGRARVVRRSPDGQDTAFGTFGSGDGQLNDPTGLGVGADRVIVADPVNRRMVVFRSDGSFQRTIAVPEWGTPFEYPDVAISERRNSIYASSPGTDEILVFSLDGDRTAVLRVAASRAGPLEAPSSLVLRPDGALLVLETAPGRITLVRP